MPQPSVFDQPKGVVKGDGRVYQTGMGAPVATAPPPVAVAPPGVGAPQAAAPGIAGAIHDAIAALASAFAPRAIQQRQTKTEADVAEATGQKPLGDQMTQ
jgi:hypothetical protein